INYEKIVQWKDPTLRSVRIDKTYRGIVKKPDSGNVYMLLWVDHHDKAYKWAAKKVCKINPATGSLQVYEIDEEQISATSVGLPEEQISADLFTGIKDKHLLRLGVPAELLPLVRTITTEEQLDQAAMRFPAEASEALYYLAAGYTLEEVFAEVSKSVNQPEADPEDYVTALDNPDTKRTFFVVEDDLVLQEMLEAPLEKWRVFLHPSQRSIVEREWNGPVRVLGGAGTGKTVVAMHRAKWLAQNIFQGANDRILFTTFTRNLAADIKDNLAKICPNKIMRRIEVVNLDRWVADFLRKHDYNYKIGYGSDFDSFWADALTMVPEDLELADTFYKEEWERIIQPHGITTFVEYAKVSRIGRGVQLNRKKRKAIWPVFEEYRLLLSEHGLREADDAMRDARVLIERKGNILPYRAVIVDEAQDMGIQAFKLIRKIVPEERKNDIFIVGDAHQRIYRHKVVLGRCGIKIIGRGRKLRINYRTTEENRRWAVNLLKGMEFDDLDNGIDNQKGYKSLLHGVAPITKNFASIQKEMDFIIDYLNQLSKKEDRLNNICLVARTHKILQRYEKGLQASGILTYLIRRSQAEDHRAEGIRLATMHRVKGLEFDRMIIAGVNNGLVPFESNRHNSEDSVIRKETAIQERALLYVAATRAKKEVVVTSFGEASRFLNSQVSELTITTHKKMSIR
ncbi:MAG TPA: ATP-dependent helicase, partial [Phycisphaerales bacterium]|nr:ATP-dependent helicase [Phycisphaerales bacterium]